MKNIKPADAFTALGLTPSDYTTAMNLAVKQNWTNLPTDIGVAELRDRIAAVVTKATPSANDLAASGFGTAVADTTDGPATALVVDRDACAKEAARLKRNAAVNAWRERNRLQAALDARDAKFAKMRAGRKKAA